MTEDEHLAAPEGSPQPRPLVQWQRTGRSRERALAFGGFAFGLLLGALLVGGATVGRQRLRNVWR